MTVFANQRTATQYILLMIIVCALSTIFLPFVLVFLLQDIFFHGKEHWFFNAPAMAYIVFGMGLLWVSVVLSLYLIIRNWREKRDLRTPGWVFTVILCGCFIFFYLGVNHYYYFSEEGLYYNDILTVHGKQYSWEDFSQVHEVIEKSDAGIQSFTRTVFVTITGEELSILFNYEYNRNRPKILAKLREHNIAVKKVIIN